MWIGVAAAIAAACLPAAAVGPGLSTAHAADSCIVPGFTRPLEQLWQPDLPAARAYAHSRRGDIAFAVRTDTTFHGYRADHQEWSASVLKAMLLVAYLDRPSVRYRNLNGHDRSLLLPMITRSDNDAATAVDHIVGDAGLSRLARRVGMRRFVPVAFPWGESRITAADQTRFFLHIDSFVPARHRAYALHLLASITPSQRWGVGRVAPRGWRLYFKGGWGSGTGLIDHQVALLTRGCARVSVAVLTMDDGTHAYGKATLRGLFSRLLKGLPEPPR
ncbi:MAG: serine hydrolase [Gaiellaceae bacterium]